jgi:hypothetical protein
MRSWFFGRWLVGSQDELIDQLANRLFRNVLFYLCVICAPIRVVSAAGRVD